MAAVRPDLSLAFRADVFGEAAIVRVPPLMDPLQVTVIVGGREAEVPSGGGGGEFTATALRTLISLRRSQVPLVPKGTTIEIGTRVWKVDTVVEMDEEVVRVLVV